MTEQIISPTWKKQNGQKYESGFLNLRHMTSGNKGDYPWKMRKKIRKLYKCPSFNYFERISEAQHKIGETEPGRSPELSA